MSDSFDPVSPRLPAGSKGTAPQPTPAPATQAAGRFSNLVFGTDLQGERLVGQSTQFPAGTKKVVSLFQHGAISAGTTWGYILTIDGQPAVDRRNMGAWEKQGTGQYWVGFDNGDKPLPNGKYELTLLLNGASVLKGTFSVAAASPTPQPKAKSTVLKGQVVDADTGRGIPAAYFVVLKPGVTPTEFLEADADEEMIATVGETDTKGNFRTSPTLPGGQTYAVAVAAKGYKVLEADGALKLPAEVPAEITLEEPIKLQRN